MRVKLSQDASVREAPVRNQGMSPDVVRILERRGKNSVTKDQDR